MTDILTTETALAGTTDDARTECTPTPEAILSRLEEIERRVGQAAETVFILEKALRQILSDDEGAL
jgi:hypothetical protein